MPNTDPDAEPVSGCLGEVGIDLVLTSRVSTLLAEHGEAVLARMLTPTELQDCRKEDRLDILSVAGRLAAKEAAFKTLAPAGTVMPWHGFQVRKAASGRPLLNLHGVARQLADEAGVTEVRISISHDGDYAAAVAVAALGTPACPRSNSLPMKETPHGSPAAAGHGLDPQEAPGA